MSIARKISYSTLMRFISYGAGIAGSILVARLLGPEVLGDFSSQFAFVSLLGFLANRGLGGAHMQLFPRTSEREDYVASFMALKCAFVFLMLAGAFVWCFFSQQVENTIVFTLCVAAVAFDELHRIPVSHFNATLEKFKAELPLFIGTICKFLFKAAVALMSVGVVGLASAEAAAGLALIGVAVFFFRKVKLGKVRKDIVWAYLCLSVPLLLVQLMGGIAPNVDKVMIDSLWVTADGSKAEVAMYTAGQRLSSIITVFTMVVSSVFFPAFARFAKDKDYSKAENIIKSYESVVVCVIAPAFLAMAVFSKPIILFLVGEEYAGASPVMQVSVIGALSVLLLRPYMSFIIGALDKIKIACVLNLFFVCAVLALNVGMIPGEFMGVPMLGLGAFGAALGTTIAYLLIGVFSKRIADQSISTNSMSRNGVEGGVLVMLTVAFFWGVHLIDLENIWLAAIGAAGFMLLYFVLLFLFRKPKVKEIVRVMQKVHPVFNRVETLLFGRK